MPRAVQQDEFEPSEQLRGHHRVELVGEETGHHWTGINGAFWGGGLVEPPLGRG